MSSSDCSEGWRVPGGRPTSWPGRRASASRALVTEAARAAKARGRTTVHIGATRAAGSIPFGALAPILAEAEAPPSSLEGRLRGAAESIARRLGNEGLLVVDDAHLLDDCSAAVVHHLVQQGGCDLYATVRTPGPTPDAVMALWKDGLATRIDLEPLTETEVGELGAHVLGAPLAGNGIRWLFEASGGNPLHAIELITAAADSGTLYAESGVWLLRLPVPATPRLLDLVTDRLEGLPVGTRQVVELLAVGEPLGLAILESNCAADAVDDAEERGLVAIREEKGRTVASLGHPLYGEVLRQAMPRSRRRRMCTQLAEALRATGGRRHGDVLRLATWQLESGRRGDPALLEKAAQMARRDYDLRLAARLGRAAMAAGAGPAAGRTVAETLILIGHHAEAESILAQLAALPLDDLERTRIAEDRAFNLGERMGDRRAAETVLIAAADETRDPVSRRHLSYLLAQASLFAGELQDALDGAEPLLDADDLGSVVRGAYATSIALAFLGRTDEALAVAERGEEAVRSDPAASTAPGATLTGTALAHLFAGQVAQAEATAEIGYGISLDLGDDEGLVMYALLRGWAQLEQGRLGQAAALFKEGLAISRAANDLAMQRTCLGGIALATGMAGDAAAAAHAVVAMDAISPHWIAFLDADLCDRGRAWARAAAGEMSAAHDVLTEAAEQASARGQVVAEARLLHDTIRLNRDRGVVPRLAELVPLVDGQLVADLARHAAAVIEGSGAGLQSAAEALELLGNAAPRRRGGDIGSRVLSARGSLPSGGGNVCQGRPPRRALWRAARPGAGRPRPRYGDYAT